MGATQLRQFVEQFTNNVGGAAQAEAGGSFSAALFCLASKLIFWPLRDSM
jgi:hypothetical protein